MLTRARRESFKLASIFAEYPYQVHDVLEQVRDGQIEVGFVHKGLDEFMQKIDVAINRLSSRSSSRRADRLEPDRGVRDVWPAGAGANVVSAFGFFLSGVLGLWLLWGVFRSGRI